jgi:hypothetical protein
MYYERSVFEGVHVVAKFYLSKSPSGDLKCISRTLGKFSILDRNFIGDVEDQDVWVCRIVREINVGRNQGTFILHPVEKVDMEQVRKIIPGFYDIRPYEHAVSIVPNSDPQDFWMLSSATRKIFSKKYYAVIVPIAYVPKQENIEKKKYTAEWPESIDVFEEVHI